MFLLLLVFMFSGLEGIYQDRAYEELLHSKRELLWKEVEKARADREEEEEEDQNKRLLGKLKEIFLSPSFLVCIVIFICLMSDVLKEVSL